MKVLLDVGISPRLRLPLQEHLGDATVETAVYRQWRALRDDELIAEATQAGFTTLVTTDKRMASEQLHSSIAIIAVDDNRLHRLRRAVPAIAGAIRGTSVGEHRIVAVV